MHQLKCLWHLLDAVNDQCCCHTVTLQWDKLKRSGALPHLGRWFDLVSTEALVKEVAEKYGPKKPSSRQEFRKEKAAAGMGGGGARHPF